MPDREKVIKGLEICVDRVPGTYRCNECPYEVDGTDCEINLTKDAITLLKEQKAVAVHDPGAYCPKCGWMLYPEDHPHHCGNCGQAVKWDA